MKLHTLHDLLHDQLKDLYSAETQLVKALPRMARNANSPELTEAFEAHLEETEGQVDRLESIAKMMNLTLTGKKCKGMEGLLKEGSEAFDASGDPAVIDGLLIAAAQRVEHYEVSGYGTARALAEVLELEEVVELLQASLDEEEAADEKLSGIATATVYPQAGANDEEEEEGEEAEDEEMDDSGETSDQDKAVTNGARRSRR